MLVKQNLIVSPDGNYLLHWTRDTQKVVDDVGQMKKSNKGWQYDRSAKVIMSVPVDEYYGWEKKLGHGCWQDKEFQKFYKAHRPEFVI